MNQPFLSRWARTFPAICALKPGFALSTHAYFLTIFLLPLTITESNTNKKGKIKGPFPKRRKMSIASSIPRIKIPNPSSSASPFSSIIKPPYIVTIRSSQAEGPLRRPVVPPLREPSLPPPLKPVPPTPSPPSSSSSSFPPAAPPKPASAAVAVDENVITLEFQRQKARELQEYFKQKKVEESNQGPFFGFIGKNEIANGRWAMFGFAVGLLTEYATGSDLVDQVKIMLSNFGIIDLE